MPERMFLACGPSNFSILYAATDTPELETIETSDVFGFLRAGTAILIVDKLIVGSPGGLGVAGRISGFSKDGDLVGTATVTKA
jgi:hypothetical protein